MSANGGAGLLLRPYVSGVPTTMAGLRTKSVKVNNDVVDVTNSDSAGRWQELLTGVAVKKLEVSGSGVLTGSSLDRTIVNAVLAGTPTQMDIVVPGLGTFSGVFVMTDYDTTTEHNKEIVYSVTIQSTGAITFS